MNLASRSSPIIIAGPTAIGKSAVAQYMAERMGAVILSADSMLVYRGMDIGTAKPTQEERGRVSYIGLDCVNPSERFSTGDWLNRVREDLLRVDPSKPIIVAGGTGLYIKTLLNGLSAQAAEKGVRLRYQAVFEEGGVEALQTIVDERLIPVVETDRNNPRRLIRALERADEESEVAKKGESIPPQFPSDTPIYCLSMERSLLAERIERRVRVMFETGLIEEAQKLVQAGMLSETASGAIGYAEALAYSRGEMTREAAIERITIRTRQLAKKQMTWFRHQLSVTWIELSPADSVADIAAKLSFQNAI